MKFHFYHALTALVCGFVCMALYPGLQAAETGGIRGKITDVDQNPIPGVTITLTGTNLAEPLKAFTNADGTFSMENVPVGEYTLLIELMGMKTIQLNKFVVSPGKVNEFNLTMEQAPFEQTVVVTGDNEILDVKSSTVRATVERNAKKELPGSDDMFSSFGMQGGVTGGGSVRVHGSPNPMTEDYDGVKDNTSAKVLYEPVSTFSIDVDTASYANTRRFLRDNELPPPEAVRVEEFINYFTYDYPQPDNPDDAFAIYYEVSECPWNAKNRLIHIGLQGRIMESGQVPPSNFVFLIDVSGSMGSPDKLPLLKQAFRLLVEQLDDKDIISIVTYAGREGVALPATSGANKAAILNAIDSLGSGGSTAGAAGIQLAYDIAQQNFIKEGNNRVILATDGDFNVGISSDQAMIELIEEKRKSGVFLSTMGFGTGNIKDSKLEKLADHGNGNYSYIDSLLEARKVLETEMHQTFYAIAKDVKIQVEFNPAKVESYRLIGYENRMLKTEDFDDDAKDAGELGAGHTVTALYEIVPAVSVPDFSAASDLRYQIHSLSKKALNGDELLFLRLRYKQPDGDKSRLIEKPLEDAKILLNKTSENFRFSAAVALFGMLVRKSEFAGDGTYDMVLELAKGSKGQDAFGYRAEFIQLVELAKLMDPKTKADVGGDKSK